MPHHHRLTCRDCGKHKRFVGTISATGRCAYCGERRHIENTRQLRAHSGPWFDHWRRRTAAAFGVIPYEEAQQ